MSDESAEPAVAELIDLVVHDLRNPVATVGANLSYVRDMIAADGEPELHEAFDDMSVALAELMSGLEQLHTVGRVIGGRTAAEPSPCDLQRCVDGALDGLSSAAAHRSEGTAEVLGGPPLARLVQILIRNAEFHGRGAIDVRSTVDGDRAIVEVVDPGPAIAEELRDLAFTIRGQRELKSRADGRYSKNAGLVTARALADAMNATLTATGNDGAACFRLELPVLRRD